MRGKLTNSENEIDWWAEMSNQGWARVFEILGKEKYDEVLSEVEQETRPMIEEIDFDRFRSMIPEEITYLSEDDILKIHDHMIDRYGGDRGLLDRKGVSDVLSRIRGSRIYGKDHLPNLFLKAGFLMHYFLRYHPFVDGQKRTGIAAAFVFLGKNGFVIWTRHLKEELGVAVWTAKGEISYEELAHWLASKVGLNLEFDFEDIDLNSDMSLDDFSFDPFKCEQCDNEVELDFPLRCEECGALYQISKGVTSSVRIDGEHELLMDIDVELQEQ